MRKNSSPQLENGYTKIANEIMDVFCHFRIPGEVRQIVDCILRKTYGWNKKEDWISHSQVVLMTNLPKGCVSRELSKAITHKIVIVHDNRLKLNKNYKEWVSFAGKHFNPKPKGVMLSSTITGLSPTITNEAKLSDTITNKKVIVSETKVIVSEGNKRHYTKDTSIYNNIKGTDKLSPTITTEAKLSDTITKKENNRLGEFKEKFIVEYNHLLKRNFRMTPKLSAHLSARLKLFTEEQILTALRNMAKNSFYLGSNDRGWFAHPEFLLRNDEQIDRFLNVKETDGIQYAD